MSSVVSASRSRTSSARRKADAQKRDRKRKLEAAKFDKGQASRHEARNKALAGYRAMLAKRNVQTEES
jgi:hypothetical protein